MRTYESVIEKMFSGTSIRRRRNGAAMIPSIEKAAPPTNENAIAVCVALESSLTFFAG